MGEIRRFQSGFRCGEYSGDGVNDTRLLCVVHGLQVYVAVV
ncbi:hypothetical protein B4086_5751 [Bacillus cereus]|nr:hypothetical protein B4086_5751 [Bacillus cereus]